MQERKDAALRGASRAREKLARILNHALQEEVVLSATLRAFLGRLAGPNFHSLSRLLGDHRRQLDEWLQEIAARVRDGGTGAEELARGLDRVVGAADAAPARDMIGELLDLHEGIAARLRGDLAECGGDAATKSLLSGLVDFHETTAWMLRTVRMVPEVPRRGR